VLDVGLAEHFWLEENCVWGVLIDDIMGFMNTILHGIGYMHILNEISKSCVRTW
jgi:hypothetical protein